MNPGDLVRVARPGLEVRLVATTDEHVLHGGGEVFRLPLEPAAVARQAVLLAALPALQVLVPVPVPAPHRVGVLADGVTPFTAERRLPGVVVDAPTGLGALQWQGVLAALDAVTPGQARTWGGSPRPTVLLRAEGREVLSGLVDWR